MGPHSLLTSSSKSEPVSCFLLEEAWVSVDSLAGRRQPDTPAAAARGVGEADVTGGPLVVVGCWARLLNFATSSENTK